MRGPEQKLWGEVGSRMDRPDIRATEVAEYAFCARSWWLKRVQGVTAESEALQVGIEAHEAAGERIATAVHADRMVKGLQWVLAALALFGLLVLLSR